MKCVVPVLVACSLLLAPSVCEAKQPSESSKSDQISQTMQVKDGSLFAIGTNGAPDVLIGKLKNVQNSDLRFKAVSPKQLEAKEFPESVKPGFYFARPDNKVIYFPAGDVKGPANLVEVVGEVSQSPDGKVMVLAVNPSPVGELFFYSWPEMQPLKSAKVPYYQTDPQHITRWVNNQEVALELFDEADDRLCAEEPCGDLSVYIVNPYTDQYAPVVYGSDLCNYTIKDVAADRITVGRLCLPTPQEWKNIPNNAKPYYETIPLPVRETR